MVNGNVVIKNAILSTTSGLGLNCNYYIDADVHRPPGSINMKDALAILNPRTIRPTNGYMSDTILWATQPTWEPASQIPAIYGWNYWASNDKRLYTTPPKPGGKFINVLNFKDIVDIKPPRTGLIIAVPLLAAYTPGSPANFKDYLLKVATEWVKYTTARKIPVNYWEISNEPTMKGNHIANISPAVYAQDVITWSKAIKAVDPTAKIAASGDHEEDFRVILNIARGHFDAFVVHSYGPWGLKNYDAYATLPPAGLTYNLQQYYKGIGYNGVGEPEIPAIVTETNIIDYSNTLTKANDTGKALMVFDMLGQQMAAKGVKEVVFWETRAFNEGRDGFPKLLQPNNTLTPAGKAFIFWTRLMRPGNFLLCQDNTPGLRTFCICSPGNFYTVWIINRTREDKTINFYPAVPGWFTNGASVAVSFSYVLSGNGYLDPNPTQKKIPGPIFTPGKPPRATITLPKTSITAFGFKISQIPGQPAKTPAPTPPAKRPGVAKTPMDLAPTTNLINPAALARRDAIIPATY